MRKFLLIVAAPTLLLSACATAPTGMRPALAASETGEGTSAYGLFLAAQAALNDGASRQASQLYDQAERRGVDPAITQERNFTASLLAGDIDRAEKLAPSGADSSPGMERMGLLVRAVDLMADGKGKDAYAILKGEGVGFPHTAARVLLSPWAAAQAGDAEGAVTRPEAGGDKIVQAFGLVGQAQLYERAKRYDEAETDYKSLLAADTNGPVFQLAYGAFLERRGRRDDAANLYRAGLATSPDDRSLTRGLERATSGKSAPPQPTLREGASQALLAATAEMLAARQQQLGLAYLRLVLRLDPERKEAWLLIGDVLAAGDDLDAARAAYGRLTPADEDYLAARNKLAWSYQRDKQPEQALTIAREAAAGGDVEAKIVLADLLRANDRYEESLALFTDLVALRPKEWRLLYGRAVVLERLNRWPEAEANLVAALALRPDEPELLNYLGYSWIDHGQKISQGIEMVSRALAANPNSGAIIDSLGWGLYRKGDYAKAMVQLERAVELEPGDPEINNHLGDVYWRAGRRLEARFQWDRVLTLEPEPRVRVNAEAKLKNGLGPDGPAEAPKLAGQ